MLDLHPFNRMNKIPIAGRQVISLMSSVGWKNTWLQILNLFLATVRNTEQWV